MHVRSVLVGAFGVNCYVVWGEALRALVIDPGADPEAIADIIESKRLTVAAYLITHGHIDHVSALTPLAARFPAPIAMHPKDAAWAFSRVNAMPPYPAPTRPPTIERPLADGQTYEDGGLKYQVIATPGHTPGGVCFHFPEAQVLFTGDTLFAGSVGRTDFPGGDDALLNASLRVLTSLPDATTVFAGHGPQSTIGQEKATNPFIRYRV